MGSDRYTSPWQPLVADLVPMGITPSGLTLPDDLDLEGWTTIGAQLAAAEKAVQWCVGDWWAFGEHRYGEAQETATALGISSETLRGYAYTAKAVDPVRRNTDLSYGHHRIVAPLEDDDQDRFLTQAAESDWSIAELTRQVRAETADREPGESRKKKDPEPAKHAERRDEAVFSVTQAANRLGDAVGVINGPGFRLSTDVAQDILREVGKLDNTRGELLQVIEDEVGALGITVPPYTPPKSTITTKVADAGNPYLAAGEQRKVSLGGLSDDVGEFTLTLEEYNERTGRA